MTNVEVSSHEFQQRVGKIQDGMKVRGLDALFIYSQRRGHVPYVSGYRPNYHTNSAVIVLPLSGEPIMWIKFPFDLPRAKAASWIDDIRPSASEDTRKMFAGCTDEMRALGLDRSRIGLVASDLAVDEMGTSLCDALRAQLPAAHLELASDLMNELRIVKSEQEMILLRNATELAERVADALRREIKPEVTEHLAAVRAAQVARLEGGECDILISSDASRMAFPPSERHYFQQGSVVNCEITVQLRGYWVQMCRVFSVGKPSDSQREVFEASRNAYEAAVRASRPGTHIRCLVEASEKVFADAGYGAHIRYGPGHGVGLDLPERHALEHDCEDQLVPGTVLVIHPAIWVQEKDAAAFVGGPIAVTANGPTRMDTPQTEIYAV